MIPPAPLDGCSGDGLPVHAAGPDTSAFAREHAALVSRHTPDPVVARLRAETKKVVEGEQFKSAIANIGDVVAYMDQPEFKAFWDADAKRVEAAVQSIGRVEG